MTAVRSAERIAAGALVAVWLAVVLGRGVAAGESPAAEIATAADEEEALVAALAEPGPAISTASSSAVTSVSAWPTTRSFSPMTGQSSRA